MQRVTCDVLVVGGGGAGLMAAYEASKHNVRVAVVNKGKVQRTGVTIMAPGAIAAVDDRWKHEGDSTDLHIKDTIQGGCYINDQEMVATVAAMAPALVLELERMGAIFQRNDAGDTYMLRIDGGHTYPRCPFLEDRTGKEMVKAMASALRKNHVPLYENIMITRLLQSGGEICGAAGIHLETGESVLFECKSLILATGGAGSLYANTDNSIDLTGDGYALALEAGAPLRDMEFVQFYPVGFLFPMALKGMLAGLLYYCRLYNAKGERFMEKYDPERLELSTRDRVSRAIVQEVLEGRGSPRGGVYMDMTFQEPGFIARMTPALYATYRNIGIGPEKERIEIAPTVHFFMGGLDVDHTWQSPLPGLFGAGEVVGGMHGGNRLSQNALAEILVSGVMAGKSAAERAAKAKPRPVDPAESQVEQNLLAGLLRVEKGLAPGEVKTRLKTIMWEHAGVFRTEESLKKALALVDALAKEPVRVPEKDLYMNRGLVEALENRNMLATARCIILSALERRESRAAHYRSDYPETDNKHHLKTILVAGRAGNLAVRTRPVALTLIQPEV
ncbi:Succinate dehydrogenase/fumarate reductase, flavoprotein subunit [uncultured delta proteobacterium]|uniref:Succinate dehydrogenase/fumarate reductase, flavoprotein subunit n=1 Tax=uncultured delta proteobacterium TaxID=34034 RepID=A0A212KBI2_9DELT|nr:Succinate dehydrogenase/fumarate reductase, flavoprotein subunit [uncultured delta proteobacterium]